MKCGSRSTRTSRTLARALSLARLIFSGISLYRSSDGTFHLKYIKYLDKSASAPVRFDLVCFILILEPILYAVRVCVYVNDSEIDSERKTEILSVNFNRDGNSLVEHELTFMCVEICRSDRPFGSHPFGCCYQVTKPFHRKNSKCGFTKRMRHCEQIVYEYSKRNAYFRKSNAPSKHSS